MDLDNLRDLYVEELRDLYSAEKQLVKALPKMADKATSSDLKQAILNHLQQTEGHVHRLEQIFSRMDTSPDGEKCKSMEAMIDEGERLLKKDAPESVLDAALIAKAQRMEHYEMAGYGTVRAFARFLDEVQDADLIGQILREETEVDHLLTKLAQTSVNVAARQGAESSDGGADRELKRERDYDRTRSRAEGRPGARRPATETRRDSGDR